MLCIASNRQRAASDSDGLRVEGMQAVTVTGGASNSNNGGGVVVVAAATAARDLRLTGNKHNSGTRV